MTKATNVDEDKTDTGTESSSTAQTITREIIRSGSSEDATLNSAQFTTNKPHQPSEIQE